MDGVNETQLLIGGEWCAAASGATLPIVDPATEETVTVAAQAERHDVEAAIRAAHEAFPAWKATPPWERSKVLRKAAALLTERSEAIARQMTLEVGKPLAQSKGELAMAADTVDWFADEARRIFGQTLQGRNADNRFMVIHQPVGVVGAFTAWNFPAVLQARKLAPALAAGCTVVTRPAEEGTGAVAMFVQCFIDAGLPPGVINLLTGKPDEISEAVLDSPLVRKITFTGSIPVGQHLIRRSADTVKRMSMELGGHAPVIIHDDVDPVRMGELAAAGKSRNNGQVCVSPTRFYVHKKHEREFLDSFAGAMSKLKIGHGLDPETQVGPLINRRRLDFIEEMVETTRGEGAKVECGARRPADMNRGFYYEPTVFSGVTDEMRIMSDEPFGPLAPVTTYETIDEVITRANALKYGLAGYVFTGSQRRAYETMEALETGIVGVNNWVAATAEMPFGGVKQSGFGRENGSQGIMDYLDTKFANIVLA